MNLGQAIGLLALIISLYILWQIRQLLLLFLTAVVLATALNQLVKGLRHWRIPRGLALLLSLVILFIFSSIVLLIIVPPFIEQVQQLIQLLPIVSSEIQLGLIWLEENILQEIFPELPEISNIIQQVRPIVTELLGRTADFFTATFGAILQLILVLVLTLMLVAKPQPYFMLFIRFFPLFYRKRVREILSRCELALGGWTVGVLIEMVFIAVLSGLGLWALQVPLVLAHAILAGLLNFIPNIGPTLSMIFPIAIALLDAPWKALAILILYVFIQQIESYWLTPLVMAKQVSLLPAITLTAQIFFASFFGVLGLLMALPLAIITKTWIEEVLFKDVLDRWKKSPS